MSVYAYTYGDIYIYMHICNYMYMIVYMQVRLYVVLYRAYTVLYVLKSFIVFSHGFVRLYILMVLQDFGVGVGLGLRKGSPA